MSGTPTSNNPMHYQYWSRNMSDIVPVALYGFRICGVGQSGYYAEMPTLPGQNGDWDFSEEAVAALEAERGKYEVYNTEHHHSEEWRPHIYTVPPPAMVIDDMRHYLATHEREYGRSADHLNVEVDYADLVEWIAALEAAQESQE